MTATKTLKMGMVGIGMVVTHQVAVPPGYDADLQVPDLEGV